MTLLEPDVHRIATIDPPPADGGQGAPEPQRPSADRAPEWVATGTPEPMRSELIDLLGADRVLARPSDIIRYASDASPYRKLPLVVVMARDAGDVARAMAYGRERGVPVTFRSGGTSLSGQAQTDGILIDVRRHFGGVKVAEGAAEATAGPGAILGHVNRVLAPFGRKLGPDPASTDIATIGGVVANNSGGMRCGIVRDSYSTVKAITFVLPSGTVIDTDAEGAERRFAEAEPELAEGLMEIRREILADEELVARIRRKFSIKNTTGYRLCAFLDGETPLEIFRLLLIGSEGTLAFIASATFETVELPARTTTAWLHFPDIASAVGPVNALVDAGATAVELMVAPALIAASYGMPGAPERWKELDPASAALLVEFGGPDEAALDRAEAATGKILEGHELIAPVTFDRDEETIETNWHVREGLHGLAGRLRPSGTALIVEDVCVPPDRIAEGAEELRALLGEHGFLPGVAGHASAGNLHFMITPDFAKAEDRERYEKFMEALVGVVIDKYDGSLKAEHGTGINMAPYVEREWGERATGLMWRVKELADPDGVLSPGVLLTRDAGAHLRDLHTNPAIEEEANVCVECGFCEPVCPSRDLTTTPRQRIVLRREMARQGGDTAVKRALLAEYEYDSLETCAIDGSCLLVCPVGIDTGALVTRFRNRQHSPRAERTALKVAKRWDRVERGARSGLKMGRSIANVLGDGALEGLTRAARNLVTEELVPEWGEAMPPAAEAGMPATERRGAAAVYVPACINRIFGRSERDGAGGPSLPEALVEVSRRAGRPVWIPADVEGSCCSVPWKSKGFADAHRFKANETAESLWRWTDGGSLPVVIDASSCAHGLIEPGEGVLTGENAARAAEIEVLDSVQWAERLLPDLEIGQKVPSATVHPTCSGRHMGTERALIAIAEQLAEEVHVPPTATCCGFAGDRGMLHPELTASATAREANEVAERTYDAYLSSNRTCEIGMERATNEPYGSFVYLLERLTR